MLYYADYKANSIGDITFRDEQDANRAFEQAGDVPKLLTLGDAVLQSTGDPNHLEHVYQRYRSIRDQLDQQPIVSDEMEVDQ